MADDAGAKIGSIAWLDLTTGRAEEARDFYREVVGWTPAPVDMGDYADFTMMAPGTGSPAAGVCHWRGVNLKIPPNVWLAYVAVANVEASATRCVELGGELVVPVTEMGSFGRFCVIRDPFGAVLALGTFA
ncbi:MAG: VOC family protein [Acidobacteriota bacterium]